MTVHTFLFQEGLWIVKGVYFDDRGHPVSLEGKTRITHFPGLWVNEGAMELKAGETSLLIHNRYEITPPEEGGSLMAWKSFNPAVGPLSGQFIIVDDAVLSTCRSEGGEFSGSEFFLKIDDGQYRNRGVFLKDGGRISSWSVELQRTADGPFPESV